MSGYTLCRNFGMPGTLPLSVGSLCQRVVVVSRVCSEDRVSLRRGPSALGILSEAVLHAVLVAYTVIVLPFRAGFHYDYYKVLQSAKHAPAGRGCGENL